MDTEISRRVRLTDTEIKILIGLTAGFDGAIIQGLHDRFVELSRENDDPSYRFMAQAYRDAVIPKDGELEMDDDAEVSMGDDPGAYVMVWTWVSDDDADIIHVSPEARRSRRPAPRPPPPGSPPRW